MKISMYQATVPAFIRSLKNLSGILDKAVAHADQNKFDLEHLLTDRLYPDMFPFLRQVQITCDYAKGTAARLAGVAIPKFPDAETTVPELKARIEKVLEFLAQFKPEDFDDSEEREIEVYFMPGKYLHGLEYLTDLAVPNFYFHLTVAYAILRHNGVPLGKNDYIGMLAFKDIAK